MNSAPASCSNPIVLPPYTPNTPYPAASDATDPVLNFPVAGGTVAFGYNLGATSCTTPANLAPLQFTSAEIENIWNGTDTNWNSADLVATNPTLGAGAGNAGCTGPIKRQARSDNSGTTGIVMFYMSHINSSASVCGTGRDWAVVSSATTNSFALPTAGSNNVWPTGGTCAAAQPTESQGTPGVISAVSTTDGAIGYGELGDWSTRAPSVPLAALADPTGATFQTPSPANCTSLGSNNLPGGGGATDAVGLNGSPAGSGAANWAADALTLGAPNKADQTFQGAGYPVCALTWDMVLKNAHLPAANTTTNPLIGLTNDQRATMYAYFLYLLSPGAQLKLASAGYAPLPAAWPATIRSGIVANY
jgi:ABC-type phosphate transport system substrate-binding protein